ncbi:hypothetical protein ACSBM8_19135 [Sphingomonas sp. ASY06-1R]|uniref:hypothetical protein n=1 Tax=Sphingomonas sp. ASY06-1R TaxID=3445771 RepID=UPI003FA1B411
MEHSAGYNAGVGIGFLLSLLLIYGAIILIGIFVSRWLTRSRGDGRKIRWPLWVAIALVLLMLLGQLGSLGRAQSSASAATSAQVALRQG